MPAFNKCKEHAELSLRINCIPVEYILMMRILNRRRISGDLPAVLCANTINRAPSGDEQEGKYPTSAYRIISITFTSSEVSSQLTKTSCDETHTYQAFAEVCLAETPTIQWKSDAIKPVRFCSCCNCLRYFVSWSGKQRAPYFSLARRRRRSFSRFDFVWFIDLNIFLQIFVDI